MENTNTADQNETTNSCQHPADQASTDELLMSCPDCGAECSGSQIGDDELCYDQACPLHVMAGEIAARGAVAQAYDKAFGLTFTEWLEAAGRTDTASDYDLRAAWRAGEDPQEYRQVSRPECGVTFSDALDWAATAAEGEYLVEYEDTGLTAEQDPGSRCGFGDDELDEINTALESNGLRLSADDRGLVAVKSVR